MHVKRNQFIVSLFIQSINQFFKSIVERKHEQEILQWKTSSPLFCLFEFHQSKKKMNRTHLDWSASEVALCCIELKSEQHEKIWSWSNRKKVSIVFHFYFYFVLLHWMWSMMIILKSDSLCNGWASLIKNSVSLFFILFLICVVIENSYPAFYCFVSSSGHQQKQ